MSELPRQNRAPIGELVIRASGGEPSAKEILLNHYTPRIQDYLGRFIPDGTDIEPILTRTISKIDQNLLGFNPTAGKYRPSHNFVNWFIKITRNEAIDSIRRLHRDTLTTKKEIRPRRQAIEDFIPDYQQRIAEILPSLYEKERDAIELMLNGDSISVISETLGIQKTAVRQRLHRGRQIIEPDLLEPAGLIRSSSIEQGKSPLDDALRRGVIEGFKYLNLWYTTPEAAQTYLITHIVHVTPKLDIQESLNWHRRTSGWLGDLFGRLKRPFYHS